MDDQLLLPSSATEGIRFHELCIFFEKVQKAKSNVARTKEFCLFLGKWNELQDKSSTFYPAFRLILPQLDKDRSAYGVKEHLLAKLYIEILQLSPSGQDAQKLLKFRHVKPSSSSLCDFAEVAFHHVLSKRCINKGSLTISEINAQLDNISTYYRNKQRDQMKKSLMVLMQKTSALEQKWLIRIMLKDMKLHLSHKILLKEFHCDAEDLYNVTTNLKLICEKLKDPSVRLSYTEINLFHPFKPMLAAKIQIDEVKSVCNERQFQMEIKYDGERSQIHKNMEKYKYFSRNGNEYSSVFGETCYQGTLSKFIHPCFSSHVVSCIIDGEMMAFNPNLGTFMQKGGKFDIKHVSEDSELQPCFIAFDLLYLNGECLAQQKQSQRFQQLKNIITPQEGRVGIAEVKLGSTNEEALQFLNEAIDRREEGIVIKDPNSFYAPNKRKYSGWYKVKPEYVNGDAGDLNLVIIGGSFGVKRLSSLSTFHLGVGVTDRNTQTPPEVFKTFCRVGSGYTDKELLQIIEKLKPNLKVLNKKDIPGWLEIGKEKPDVIIHPKHSLVVQVRASEIIPSGAYSTNCTLRFPRLVAVREDKSYADALMFDELNNLWQANDGKLAKSHVTMETCQPPKKQKKQHFENLTTILPHFQGIDAAGISKVSTSFEGKVFCVITGTQNAPKQDVEKLIIERGGKCVQNPSSEVTIIIADDERHVKVRNIKRTKKYDVVRSSWLFRCIESDRLVLWKPAELICTTPQTQSKLQETYDKFGDDFTETVDFDWMTAIFLSIDKENLVSMQPPKDAVSGSEALQLFNEDVYTRFHILGFDDSQGYLFKGLHFCLPCKDECSVLEKAYFTELQSMILFYGGCLGKLTDRKLSHVIIDEHLMNEKLHHQIKKENQKSHKRYYILSAQWIRDCIEQKDLLSERSYFALFSTKCVHNKTVPT